MTHDSEELLDARVVGDEDEQADYENPAVRQEHGDKHKDDAVPGRGLRKQIDDIGSEH